MMLPRVNASKLLIVTLLLCSDLSGAQERNIGMTARSTANRGVNPSESELSKARTDVIEKIKETRAGAEKLLALHEAERQRRASEYERRRDLYGQGLIARNEVLQAENNLIEAMRRVDEDKRWISETDMAVTEAAMRDELLRLPGLAIGGYSETTTLLRFNGASLWTLAQATKIESFFTERFGHALPISALGQTATHDRLHFDHRNAMDVALHPDSREGQALLSYLRQAGIPFIAFRSAVPGAATGAHIHIGKPSARF
jgi:hypothetical protein